MKKTIIWTIIIYSIIISLIGYLYYEHKNQEFNIQLKQINHKYQNKYDSLNNKIYTYKIKIKHLDSLILITDNKIDSIKNKQKTHEKPIFTSFRNISTDSIVNLFSRYNKE